jgi:7-cyano-7-deazaguanine synthase
VRINRVTSVAVLASGGLDSCVLVYDLAGDHDVTPLYIQKGLAWEAEEQHALEQFVKHMNHPRVDVPVVLPLPVDALYGQHWSVTGDGVPAADAPDEHVFLPARNILLFTAAAIWCRAQGVHQIAVGSLDGNPFPDATDAFFADLARLLSTALSHDITILAPFRHMKKESLIDRFQHLPLALTLTCNAPQTGLHCGACNKCYERQLAFEKAGVQDYTEYAR